MKTCAQILKKIAGRYQERTRKKTKQTTNSWHISENSHNSSVDPQSRKEKTSFIKR